MELATATLLTSVVVVLCIVIHYEALNLLNNTVTRFRRHRTSLLVAMYGLFVAHVVEILLFAIGYAIGDIWLDLGQMVPPIERWLDYGYFSAMVYTTVGFGDLIPQGASRIMTMAEALAGLCLITWSASFTFLQMSRLWR